MRAIAAGVIVTGALVALGGSAARQTLGDAAKRAQEQRKENAGKGTRIEIIQEGRPLDTVKLDRAVVTHYTNARLAMAKLWQRDPAMYQRVRIAVQNARTMREYAQALMAEKPIADLFALYQYTPETFLATEITIRQTQRLAEGGFDMSALSDVQKENYHWIARELAWLSIMRGRLVKAEAGMSLWE